MNTTIRKISREELLKLVDHTLLKVNATWPQIRVLCDDAIAFHTASVCIPPCFVKQAREYVKDRMKVCTVIGFPNGYEATAVKVFETKQAVADGADEIDMVINIGALKEGRYDYVEDEIAQIRSACPGHILKVIIETCLLTEEEKIECCGMVCRTGADFIKTSTGFSTGGATPEDIALFAAHIKPPVLIKAAGGISSFEDAETLVSLGASRLGTSRLVALAKAQ